MKKITVTEEKRMLVSERKEAMPYELLADGDVVGVVRNPDDSFASGRITCPNCKFVLDIPKQDNTPAPFSIHHP